MPPATRTLRAQGAGGAVQAPLPDFDVDTHFTPRYMPWTQRLCLVPDNDLFKAIRGGNISIVTDEIATFTQSGIRLKSAQELTADIIVSATGLQLCPLGNIDFTVDVWLHQNLMDHAVRPHLRIRMPRLATHG